MTNEMKRNFDNHGLLTLEALDDLKEKGYKYLQVQGFTQDHHPEYIAPCYLMLVPKKIMESGKNKMDIYEDISGETIIDWAKKGDDENLHLFLAKAE